MFCRQCLTDHLESEGCDGSDGLAREFANVAGRAREAVSPALALTVEAAAAGSRGMAEAAREAILSVLAELVELEAARVEDEAVAAAEARAEAPFDAVRGFNGLGGR